MSDPKSQRIEELEKQVSDLQEQCKARYETIEKLNAENDSLSRKCNGLQDCCETAEKHVTALKEENKKLNEMLGISDRAREAAGKELERAKKSLEVEINEKARIYSLYDEIKIKNANICSTIADMVRKIMIE